MWRGWRCGTCPSRRWRRRGRKTPETHTGRIQTECHVSTEREEENNSVQTNQSLCDDGSRRRPGEDFNLTRSVNQHIPAEVKGQRDKLSVKQRGWRGLWGSSWAENHTGSLNHINWPMILLLLLYELHHLKDTNKHVFFHYSVQFSSWLHQNTSHLDI